MQKVFRLHGDNIVECERIANLIIRNLVRNATIKRGFLSLACPYVEICFEKDDVWRLEFFPGFNKHNSDRWSSNILDLLSNKGSFLSETPDIIFTKVEDGKEDILFAIEFCSALQAGNQAWQRSGRAYSVGRTGIPYIYLLDFVKYELDPRSRERKALRFQNPAIAYSYVAYAKSTGNFVVQTYIKAEEFQPDYDDALKSFSETIFGDKELAIYILKKMKGEDTTDIEQILINKNIEMVKCLLKEYNGEKSDDGVEKIGETALSESDWKKIYTNNIDIIQYSKRKKLRFKKKIAEKSAHGNVVEFRDLCSQYGVGVASADLPFGIIPAESRQEFVNKLVDLYCIDDQAKIDKLNENKDLIVCLLKGFKPGGDDNRPDRGALPLIAMLTGENVEILTFIYGPLIKKNFTNLAANIKKLYTDNGLWKSVIGLSNIILVDSLVPGSNEKEQMLINNTANKKSCLSTQSNSESRYISPNPSHFQENDVDGILHYIFKHIAMDNSFEGMCNPPGGDWSGLSIKDKEEEKEYRWLSLPRVSGTGKRPDHVFELFNIGDKPIILVVESKEKGNDLEKNIGTALKSYLINLFNYVPSVERGADSDWVIAKNKQSFTNYECISVGAYLDDGRTDSSALMAYTKCDMLFALTPNIKDNIWELHIECGEKLFYIKEYLSKLLRADKILPARIN